MRPSPATVRDRAFPSCSALESRIRRRAASSLLGALLLGAGAAQAETAAGMLPGALSVGQTGAATYTMPIEVPPGTADMEPSLAFSYNSGGGNGLLGQGWSLQGLSAINRCPKTAAQDSTRGSIGYDAQDRFCMDGQRLVAIRGTYGADGTEYRTEIDTFVQVFSRGKAGSGPARFEVWTKSGQHLEYGATADSRIEAAGKPEARQWLLSRATDAVGNYLTVSYREEDGLAYPNRIDYSGYANGADSTAPYASVRFGYENRHDAKAAYLAGSKALMDERLAHVRTYVCETLVSDYRLEYSATKFPQPSRVVGIKRCDGSGDCLVATGITWNAVGGGYLSAAKSSTPSGKNHASHLAEVGDFNGDGISDIAWTHQSGSGLSASIALGSSDGSLSSAHSSSPRSGNFSAYQASGGDFNGDGISDMVWTHRSSSGLYSYTALGTGSGTLAAAQYDRSGLGDYRSYEEPLADDFNGDGIADLAWTRAYGSGLRAYIALGNGSGTFNAPSFSAPASGNRTGYKALTGDVNGDGAADLVWTHRSSSGLRVYVALSNGNGTLAAAQYGRPSSSNFHHYEDPTFGDFNGDRMLDLAWTHQGGSGLRAYVALGKGDGTFAGAVSSSPLSGNRTGYKALAGDANGDGISDLVWTHQSGFNLHAYVALGEGDGTFAPARSSTPRQVNLPKNGLFFAKQGTYHALSGDFNGDGVLDVGWVWAHGSGLSVRVAAATVAADYGRVASIRSDTGPTFTLDYAPLTDGTLYAKDTGANRCARPCMDLQAPFHAVRQVANDYGAGRIHTIRYRYGGAKADMAGRGFLGFRWMEATDRQTGILSMTEYRQDFPYIGQISASKRSLADGTTVSSVANTWASSSLNGGKTKFPYVSTGTATTYELEDGPKNAAVTAVATTSSYDNYGNPTKIVVRTTGAGGTFAKTTTNTYVNDTTQWHLGRLTCATMRSEAPGQKAQTRTSGFAYAGASGLLVKEVVEPGQGDVPGCVSAAAGTGITLTTSYVYNRYGNRRTTTVSGPGLAARSTTTNWGELTASGRPVWNGRFPVKQVNALGHAEHRWYSPGHGKLAKIQGPNCLDTRWEHDGFGRVLREARADGTQAITSYRLCGGADVGCPAGAVSAVITQGSGSGETIRYLDRRELTVRVRTEGLNGKRVYQDTQHDALGRAVRSSQPYFSGTKANWARFVYDAGGRLKEEHFPDGRQTLRYYDGLESDGLGGKGIRERVVSVPAGATKKSVKPVSSRMIDSLGRVVRATDALGNWLRYTHDAQGNLVRLIDVGEKTSTLTYDQRGRRLSLTDPDTGKSQYAYNGLGELLTQTDAKKQTASMSYDLLGRMTKRVEKEGTTTWTWDTGWKGKLHRVSGPGYIRTHAYDTLGRAQSETVALGTETYAVSRSYDGAGRLYKLTYPSTGFAVVHGYAASGHLKTVSDAATPSKTYWRANNLTAEGQLRKATYGNGVSTRWSYHAKSGRLASIRSGLKNTSTVQNAGYAYDGFGNLNTRENRLEDVYEQFAYDRLHRLTSAQLHDSDTKAQLLRKTYAYDASGNILNKSDVGSANYTYGSGNAAGSGDAGPHAVISTGTGATYAYDDNGNMVSRSAGTPGGTRTMAWTSFNKLSSISSASVSTAFAYGPERGRVRQTSQQGASTTTTTYIGALYEKVARTGQAAQHVHYVFAAGQRVAIYTTDNAATKPISTLRYLHADHLGSVDVVTNESGTVAERLSYDAFGKRRVAQGPQTWRDAALPLKGGQTPRGFTGHEHHDDFGLVNMNGRVYDPAIGRFLSADPFVQFPLSTQGFNRYSYAGNNPLAHVDPSGYFWKGVKSLWNKAKRLVKKALSNKVVRMVAAAAFYYYGGTIGADFLLGTGANGLTYAMVEGAIGGFGAGLIASGGDFRAAWVGGLTGAGFGWAGGAGLSTAGRVLAHGVVGGTSAELSGGKFADGFYSAGFAAMAAPKVETAVKDGTISKFVASAVVAGTASALGGRKFANGAAMAAFVYLAAEAFEYARRITNASSLKAYSARGQEPVYDSNGELMTYGERGTAGDPNSFTSDFVEGSGKMPFDKGQPFASRLIREFVVDVSKVHDLMNEWSYNSQGQYIGGRGIAFDSAFQVYNVAGMIPAAVMTLAAKVGRAPLGSHLLTFQISGWL